MTNNNKKLDQLKPEQKQDFFEGIAAASVALDEHILKKWIKCKKKVWNIKKCKLRILEKVKKALTKLR